MALSVLVALLPCRLASQATVTVPLDDPAYRAIERLVANGLVRGAILGQRPYSRREIARIVAEAAQSLDRLRGPLASSTLPGNELDGLGRRISSLEELLDAMHEDYADELLPLERPHAEGRWVVYPWRSLTFDLTTSDGSRRRVPPSNGLGEVDASIDPLTTNRGGRVFVDGENLSAESVHALQSRYVAAGVRPRFLAAWDSSRGRTRTRWSLEAAQLRLLLGNVAVDVGRDHVMWGQGRDVGLLASTSSPAFDMIRVSTDRALTLPWVLRRLGYSRVTAFYADLGAAQNFPHPYFIGYKMSFAPSGRVELGASVFTKSGGHGAPRATFSSRVVDAFPFLQAAFYNNLFGTRNQGEFSDRYAGVDGRLRFPRARGMTLFGEILLNDFDVRRLGSVLWEDAGHVGGVVIPRLGGAQEWTVRAEAHHTGIRYYEHHQFTSGQTLRGQLIGDALGPDAIGTYVTVDWDVSARKRFSIDLALERRSNDQYRSVPRGGSLAFVRTEARPRETRQRIGVTWSMGSRPRGVGVLTQLGYERSQNFDFVRGTNSDGLLARLSLDLRSR